MSKRGYGKVRKSWVEGFKTILAPLPFMRDRGEERKK